ncbi:ABC transporter substrate-binding protein [Mastigocoleus testarum]|uniref:Iron ABC transporter substrate-binding protein n=1 Tax=Mastigocoleus testarum BC008 TaxID=371196 RepID=A0A0V7ZGC9_9CYAN|nr:ABC transporter substrate-binding protein [Mastigocoleus testarum]KST63632.1 iron ABC transporter substrate-binding protein [Mastigocoleus testarum BC008]
MLASIRIFLSSLLIVLFVTGCTTTTDKPNSTITSDPEVALTKSSQTTNSPVQRVVSLSPLVADIIYQLDSTKLVGIPGSSLLKKNSALDNVTRVSQGTTPPDLEKIVSLKPDLVIGAEGFSNQTTTKLEKLGIATLLTKVNTWESLEELTKNLAQTIGADPKPLLKRYQTFLPENNQGNKLQGEKVSGLVLVSTQPILSPNKNSWAGDLLTKFQVKNVAADLQSKSPIAGYVTLSAEKILQQNPDTLFIINPPSGQDETELLKSFQKQSFWSELQATQNKRVYIFDYHGLINPGSIDSIEAACEKLKQAVNSK